MKNVIIVLQIIVPNEGDQKNGIYRVIRFRTGSYEGSFVKMLSALNGGERLRAEEITELKNLLKEWERE